MADTTLKPAEERFAVLLSQGMNGRQACKMAFPRAGISDSAFDEKASRLKRKPAVEARLRTLVIEQKIEDVYSRTAGCSQRGVEGSWLG